MTASFEIILVLLEAGCPYKCTFILQNQRPYLEYKTKVTEALKKISIELNASLHLGKCMGNFIIFFFSRHVVFFGPCACVCVCVCSLVTFFFLVCLFSVLILCVCVCVCVKYGVNRGKSSYKFTAH